MALDQEDGDYDSYVGNTVLTAASTSDGVLGSEQMVDATLVAAAADLVLLEAETLTAHPTRAQAVRVRATARVLTLSNELAPGFALPRRELDALSELLDRWDETSDAGRAHTAHRCAMAVVGQVPSVVRDAVNITLLPTTRMHDEQMFVRCIQIFESLYRQVADRIAQSIIALDSGDTARPLALLGEAANRVRATQGLYRVLTTMPPDAFAVIRAHTNGRSAVQSRPYRQVEDLSAPRPSDGQGPGEAHGMTLQGTLLLREADLGSQPAADIRKVMRELDSAWRAMKRSHWGVTLKTIGRVSGTGGTAGADYLRATAQRALFPLLTTNTPT
ncbi:hypothetical protein Q8791_10615 [Nocardiopsis sp. CT-R113]|uniref:Tryptophan 2,3-dioxygenase n=1 Tax=Nocardiopsis codii TaxID=3065942 RepID=A0ABU7K5Z3_9ACTN|nr:hypothetical protein [Nocardiopsis sp. CT-R113]MEE2037671.1 hypothetical protein [Nocardiopsis sp. CT-R113]